MSDQRESFAGRECPVPGCEQRYLSARAAGRHLERAHEDGARWRAAGADGYRLELIVEEGLATIFDGAGDDEQLKTHWLSIDATALVSESEMQ